MLSVFLFRSLAFFARQKRGQRLLWALGFGALSAFAFVPFNLFPLFWISFPALALLLRASHTKKQAFAIGWAFAFAQLVIDLHWMSGALFVDLASFGWVLPLSLCGLPALLALYYGIAGAVFHAALAKTPKGSFVLLAALWTLAELARAHLFTGLPWDIAGYIWADFLPVLQSVSLFGIEGLTCLTLLAALAPTAWIEPRGRVRAFALAALLLLPALTVWGALRLSNAQTTFVADVRLRLVQPDQAQTTKWRGDLRAANFTRLLALSFQGKGEKPVTHFLWPETATAYYLTQEPAARSAIAAHMPQGSALVTGVVRRDGEGRYYNSLIVLDDRGNVVGGYDKHHLVPFGEYVPLRDLLPLPMISAFGANFTAGPSVQTLRAPSLPPFGALVCYEAIFSGAVAEKSDPPAFLFNATNDGWYEGTIGPAQHFAMVRPRAIEEGLPFVRVANKGTSAVLDPWGRVSAKISNENGGFLDADLPEKLSKPTFMQKQQVKPVWLILVLLFSLFGCGNLPLSQKKG